MSPEWVLLGALCVFWGFYLLRPLLTGRAGVTTSDERSRLIEAKRGYLFALRDAEVDFESGKLSEEDFLSIRRRLEEKASETIRLLDEIGGGTPEEKIAHALEALRKSSTSRAAASADAHSARAEASAPNER